MLKAPPHGGRSDIVIGANVLVILVNHFEEKYTDLDISVLV